MVTVFLCYHRALTAGKWISEVFPRQDRLDEVFCRGKPSLSLKVQFQSELDLSRIKRYSKVTPMQTEVLGHGAAERDFFFFFF